MLKEENFDDVKVGDKIAYNGSFYSKCMTIATVTHVTPKQFKDDKGRCFRKSDGFEVGGTYKRCFHATEEITKQVKECLQKAQRVKKIYDFFKFYNVIERMKEEDMVSVIEIINKYQNKQQ